MRLQPGQTMLLQPARNLQPLLDAQGLAVPLMEATLGRREEPDTGRELQVQVERLQVLDQLLGVAPCGLGTKVNQDGDNISLSERVDSFAGSQCDEILARRRALARSAQGQTKSECHISGSESDAEKTGLSNHRLQCAAL